MAMLNLEFYRGEDNYSDGTIEDDILEMVKSGELDDEKVTTSNSYPIIYHLSYLRENIMNWYPFDSKASMLEIGAGCGAITGLLCQKLKKVVAVELTKRRATINFERNREKDNLEIFVGNFNNMTFDCEFDYIVLNGVFEYAISFTEGDNPYVDFINYIKGFLKPDGKILIAIENRLGLKYFAGAREDHTGRFFSGLNQYDDTEFVRTFTKNELIDILKKSGLEQYKFFYPYPDYKFPTEIFTDKTINTEKFGKKYSAFDSERLNLFNENSVSHTLANEKIAEYFSNSFLVEVKMNKKPEKTEVLYVKLSNDRKKEYRIATILQNDDGKLIAIKQGLSREAEQHIKNLYNSGFCEIHSNIENIKGNYEKNKVIYPLLENKTMSQEISLYIKDKKPEYIVNVLKRFYQYMFSTTIKSSNYSTSKFKEVFGEDYISIEFNCIKPANIDLICDNIFIDKEKFIIIDTEWIFDFLVPLEFIMWRLIHDLYENNLKLNVIIDKDELFNLFSIDSSMVSVFIKWINCFADTYISNNKMNNNAKKRSYDVALDSVIKEYQNAGKLNSNLYYDIGNGFLENNRISSTVELKENNFEVSYDLSTLKKNLHGLRWDPVENQPCRCSLTKVEIDQGQTLIPINAYSSINSVDLFLNNDPMYIATEISPNTKYIKITGKFEAIDIKECISMFEGNISQMKEHEISLSTDFNQKSEHYKKLIEELEDKMEENKKVLKQLTDLKIEMCDKLKLNEEETKNLSALVQTYANSTSWKITSGLRWTGQFIEKGLNKIRKVKKIYKNINSSIEIEKFEGSADKRKIILIVSHTDYLNSIGGTEKYIFEQIQNFKNEDRECLQVFPIQRNHFLEQGGALYGVNFEEKMIGSFDIEHINKIIEEKTENIEVAYIHHLMYWKNEDVTRVINQLKRANTKIAVYLHDCFSCCPSIYNVYTKGEALGDCILSSNNIDLNICSSCKYKSEVDIWRSRFKFVFENADVIVSPSEFLSLIFNKIYEGYKEKMIVQGHLKLINPTKVKEKKIRIAYLGYKSEFKGWNTWKTIYENEQLNSGYEFYHIGSQEQYAGNVKCFSYSFIQKGLMGAVELLNSNQIDLVLLWSMLPESYSYTLYESIAAGVPILTNNKSGNIAYSIIKSKDEIGKVFENEKELLSFLSDYKQVYNIINQPRYRYDLQYNPYKLD